MSEDIKTETETTRRVDAGMFRARPKADPMDLDIDGALAEYAATLQGLAPLKKRLENLKVVVKTLLKEAGGKYTSPSGIRAQFVSKQAAKLNKALAKELCGARWAEVETFVTETNLRVDVPGVKGD
jgi:hypothetical protein